MVLTFVCLVLMGKAQPALLYLVPCTLIPCVLIALYRKEMKKFWNGNSYQVRRDYCGPVSRCCLFFIQRAQLVRSRGTIAVGLGLASSGTKSLLVVIILCPMLSHLVPFNPTYSQDCYDCKNNVEAGMLPMLP